MSKQIIANTGNINTEIVDKSNLNFTELYTLVESTGDLLFDKPFGRRYGTWDTPVTGDLVIDETGAQDGYCVVVVWSGATTPNITGGNLGCIVGSVDEQETYNIYFNRIDGKYNVNILKQSVPSATAPTITATQDIDSVITVTNPSVLEFDTLLGYNNYSDQDGQLGTTMTPTEATNGHTVALSDGVVHEVTTKPVGTTNGEFSAVVSNAVEVDLSGGGTILYNFAGSTLDPDFTLVNPNTGSVVLSQNNGLIASSVSTISTENREDGIEHDRTFSSGTFIFDYKQAEDAQGGGIVLWDGVKFAGFIMQGVQENTYLRTYSSDGEGDTTAITWVDKLLRLVFTGSAITFGWSDDAGSSWTDIESLSFIPDSGVANFMFYQRNYAVGGVGGTDGYDSLITTLEVTDYVEVL